MAKHSDSSLPSAAATWNEVGEAKAKYELELEASKAKLEVIEKHFNELQVLLDKIRDGFRVAEDALRQSREREENVTRENKALQQRITELENSQRDKIENENEAFVRHTNELRRQCHDFMDKSSGDCYIDGELDHFEYPGTLGLRELYENNSQLLQRLYEIEKAECTTDRLAILSDAMFNYRRLELDNSREMARTLNAFKFKDNGEQQSGNAGHPETS